MTGRKRRMAFVAIRYDADRLRPGNRQHRIERQDAAFVIGGIIFAVEIDQLDIVRQRLEPMPASFGNKKRPAIVGQRRLHVRPKKSRRTAAEIDRDVADGALQAHDDFLLDLWGDLEMYSA